MAIAKANGATPPRCRQTSFGWASDCPSRGAHVATHADAARVPWEPAALRLRPRAMHRDRNRGRAVALSSWNARLRRVCESKRVPSPRLRFHRWPNRRRVTQQPQGQPDRNSSDGASTHPTEEVKMRRGLTIAALVAGFVTMSTLPAAAQGWGYYEGWSGPPRGFGISIGFGSPYYGNWGYGYAPPAAYAYSAPAGYAYSAPVEYGYAGWGGPDVYGSRVYGSGGPIYAYEPDYTYGPSYAYETYTTGPGYGWRRARVGARAAVASSKPDKSRHALNCGHGPVQRTGPCFCWPSRACCTRTPPPRLGGPRGHASPTCSCRKRSRGPFHCFRVVLYNEKGGYTRRSRRGRRRHHPRSL